MVEAVGALNPGSSTEKEEQQLLSLPDGLFSHEFRGHRLYIVSEELFRVHWSSGHLPGGASPALHPVRGLQAEKRGVWDAVFAWQESREDDLSLTKATTKTPSGTKHIGGPNKNLAASK